MIDAAWRGPFFRVWLGQACSLLGSGLVSFTLIWYLTDATQSESILALGALCTLLPTMLFGPFIGSIVDRWNRRTIMILADATVAILTLGLLFLFLTDQIAVWHILLVNFLRALGGTFQHPAMMASTALMVPQEHLTRVGGMNRVLSGLLRLIVPAAGALLIKLWDIEAVLLIDVVTALLAIVLLLGTCVPQPVRNADQSARHSVLQETKQGFMAVRHHPSLFYVVMTCTLANIFLGPAISFKPLLITRVFGGGLLEIGYLNTVAGLSVLAGGVLMSLWRGFPRRLITSGLGWAGVGVAYVAIACLPGQAFVALLFCTFTAGCFSAIGGAPLDAYYQTTVTPDMQGRVFAVLAMLDNLTVPIGLILAASLGDRVPLRMWFLLVGLSHAILGIAWQFSRRIRQAEQPAADR